MPAPLFFYDDNNMVFRVVDLKAFDPATGDEVSLPGGLTAKATIKEHETGTVLVGPLDMTLASTTAWYRFTVANAPAWEANTTYVGVVQLLQAGAVVATWQGVIHRKTRGAT